MGQSKSLLNTHLLSFSGENELLPSNIVENSITTTILVVILGLIALIFVLHRKQVLLILQGLFSQRIISQLLRDMKLIKERISILLFLVSYLIQTLFLFALLSTFLPNLYNSLFLPLRYLIPVGLVLLDGIFKRITSNLFTYLFDCKENRDSILLYKLLFITLNSFCLFPILISFFYTGEWLILLLYAPIFLTTFLILFYRLYILNIKNNNKFQFFLYFCTIEILPYIVLFKAVLSLEK